LVLKIALIFAGNEPFDTLASPNRVINVPSGTRAALAAFKDRRDDLGTTHHDAGTMRMGDNIADAVTNDFGRIHDTTNCYVAEPALFPASGSPNQMLTGAALGWRTAELLNARVLPGPDPIVSPQSEAGFRPLFDGSADSFGRWRLAGPGGGGMADINGEMVSYGDGGLWLFFYAPETFGDFTLRAVQDFRPGETQQWCVSPLSEPQAGSRRRGAAAARLPQGGVRSERSGLKPVITGFEVQIDDNAIGDSTKDFYGIRPEPNGRYKNRTGAIYKIRATSTTRPGSRVASDRIWHLLNMLPKFELDPIKMYLATLRTVRRPCTTACCTTERSCSSRIRSAASRATSAAPSTDIPTSAACREGASLMPSPMKPTT
jgi:hypothetical protein